MACHRPNIKNHKFLVANTQHKVHDYAAAEVCLELENEC
jgi:hypothetical protein